MRVEELRINNWLNHDGIFRQVSSLHSDNTLRFKDRESSIGCFKATISTIDPIELTEEILLKCGFVKTNIQFDLKTSDFEISMYFYDIWHLSFISKNQSAELIGYWNLNQLQNIYFALTNQELNIEL